MLHATSSFMQALNQSVTPVQNWHGKLRQEHEQLQSFQLS